LSEGQLQEFYAYHPESSEEERAKDFWLLSFILYGQQMADIARWRFHQWNREEGIVTVIRHKTRDKKLIREEVELPISETAQIIFDRYKSEDEDPDNYIFPIIERGLSEKRIKTKINDFYSITNPILKNIARRLKWSKADQFSMVWARHTAPTIGNEYGAEKENARYLMGHSSTKQTETYLTYTKRLVKNRETISKLDAILKGKNNSSEII
jgi:integrase